MIDIDLDFLVENFSGADLRHYLETIRSGSDSDLIAFKAAVKEHSRKYGERPRLAFQDVENFTPHDALIAAARWEQIKRSKTRTAVYDLALPLRKLWRGFWAGEELKENKWMGPLFVRKKTPPRSFRSLGLKRWPVQIVVLPTLRYVGRNAYWIVPTIVGTTAVIYAAHLTVDGR